jgi:tripartite-type tricarboxylate transporter receptor subunit TctC
MRFRQQVVVVNHPGANGSVAAHAASEVTPDGYTLYMPVLSTFVALHSLAPKRSCQDMWRFVHALEPTSAKPKRGSSRSHEFSALPAPEKPMLPIGFVAENPMFVAVNPSLGVSTLPELVALAKKKPGKVSFAVTGVGRLTHLTGEVLQQQAGIKLLTVPYTGGPAAALGDVASGRVSMIIEGYSGIVGSVRAKQVKLIAVASAKRLPQFPNVPTVAETLPGFTATGWQVLLAPLGTPQTIINKVSSDLATVVSDPAFQARLGHVGSYTRPMTPQQVLDFVKQEQE